MYVGYVSARLLKRNTVHKSRFTRAPLSNNILSYVSPHYGPSDVNVVCGTVSVRAHDGLHGIYIFIFKRKMLLHNASGALEMSSESFD